MSEGDALLEAARDYRYLLDRGYPQKLSLDAVTSRWRLSQRQRMILYRCVHPRSLAERVRSSLVGPEELAGKRVVIDTYNVLLTIYAADVCEDVYLCDDGLVRDVLSVRKPVIKSPELVEKAEKAVAYLRELGASSAVFVMERQVSMSGRLAAAIASRLGGAGGMEVRAYTVDRTDREVIARSLGSDSVVCSSDVVVLMNARRAFDLAGYVVLREWYPRKPARLFAERSL